MKKIVYHYIIIATLTVTANLTFAQSESLTLEEGVMANENIDKLYLTFSDAYSALDTSKFK